MFPNQDGGGGGNLEDRLRGMIMSNSSTNPVSSPSGPPQLPPHMMASSPGEQQKYMASTPAGPAPATNSNEARPGPGKKRPNQAQRRQMNSQISIPIDPRHGPPAGRGSGGFGPQHHWQQPNYHGQPPANQNPRFQQQQEHSPRFNHGQGSPYSPRFQNPQASPGSPGHYQTRPGPQFSPGPELYQQNHPGQYGRPHPQNRQLYQPGPNHGQGQVRARPPLNSEEVSVQCAYIDALVQTYVTSVSLDAQEATEKGNFRTLVEQACREAITRHEKEEMGNDKFDADTVGLVCFGSMASGFATKASDMDLALLTPKSSPPSDSPESVIPRLLEKTLLDLGFGARLLTRTRVPIIKLCEKPTKKLLADLLEERAKWEVGSSADRGGEPEAEEVVVEPESLDRRRGSGGQGSPAEEAAVPHNKKESYEEKLASLKQKDQQSLADYYNDAKRLLRRLGSRDLTASSPRLEDKETKILNDVCKAFISGLSSSTLSERLRGYKSISPLFDASSPTTVDFVLFPVQRSLQGIWNQIEGEQWASQWDARPLTQCNDKDEFQCLQLVEGWRTVQDKLVPITEVPIFNRQVWVALERLKKISSLQLVFLEQLQHESPLAYLNRTSNIMTDLKQGWDSMERDTVTPIVIAHHVSGISNAEIRDTMLNSDRAGASLQQVGFQHQALQLALDYERGLKSNLFDEGDQPAVKQYIEHLRSWDIKAEATIKVEAELLEKIRTLSDPMKSSRPGPRDRYRDHLEFPKSGIGILCDINFSAELAIHNTQLLRCYSHTDPRVREMVLFVKYWAKIRGINTPYRGSLSSYGYVLMVLHYLVNIAQPFVCPNLQMMNCKPSANLSLAEQEAQSVCKGRNVQFWRREREIESLAEKDMLNKNRESVGSLLRGFFEYYANTGYLSAYNSRGFEWGREVLSLRTPGGILLKQDKGWVGAKTVVEVTTIAAPPTPVTPKASLTPSTNPATVSTESEAKVPKLQNKTVEETKEIRHRYLFAIEDPFELDHNVARTVTHDGIVSIRDEFRRAWRIIKSVGKVHGGNDGDLLDPIAPSTEKGGLQELLNLLHGPPAKSNV